MINHSANASWNGDNFQIAASISLLIDNLSNFSSIRCEGKTEDIEIYFPDGKFIAAQAKASYDENSSNTLKYLDKGLSTLHDASLKKDCIKQIYTTNIESLLGSKTVLGDFINGQTIWFDELGSINKKLLSERKCSSWIKSSFGIHYLKYTGKQKEKWALDKMKEYFRNIPSLQKLNAIEVFKVWKIYLESNAAEQDTTICCKRDKLIWGIILQRIEDIDNEISSEADENCPEIINNYGDLINSLTGQFQILSRIIGDYDKNKSKNNNLSIRDYSDNNYMLYLDIVDDFNINNELKIKLIKILVRTILSRESLIKNVRKEMKV